MSGECVGTAGEAANSSLAQGSPASVFSCSQHVGLFSNLFGQFSVYPLARRSQNSPASSPSLKQHLSGEGRFVRTHLFLGVPWVDRFECGIWLLTAASLIDPLAGDGEEFPGLLIHTETRWSRLAGDVQPKWGSVFCLVLVTSKGK